MKRILIILLFFNPFFLKAQLESNIWYFGVYAGITFSTNPPSALTNGAMVAGEGCATMCNSAGNLLFYTDGITVYNKLHLVMDNGTGLFGHASATQSAVIVPKPASANIYYVFTVDAENLNGYGVRYSTVDISMNGGLGKVISKNLPLLAPAAEKITVARHSNNQSWWLITHGVFNDNFYSFLITSAGINTTSVVSSVGSYQNSGYPMIGYMKISPNNQKIAYAKWFGGSLELFDFNNTTGVVSNALSLSNNEDFYGVEFSPDNSKLYATLFNAIIVLQYDILSPNIANTRDTIGYGQIASGALQTGPDGKIYYTDLNNDSIGVINNPNDFNCNFVPNAIYLAGRTCKIGLPNFIPALVVNHCAPDASFYASDTVICAGSHISFTNTSPSAITTSQLWLINGQVFDTSFNSVYTFPNGGVFAISLIACHDTCCDTANLVVTVNSAPQTLLFPEICQGNSFSVGSNNYSVSGIYSDTITSVSGCDSIIITNLTVSPPVQNTINPVICTGQSFSVGTNVYSDPGLYMDTIVTAEGCDSIVITNLLVQEYPEIDLGKDTTVCDGIEYLLDATYPNANYLWQDASTLAGYSVILQGWYSVVVTVNGCISKDSIFIELINCDAILEIPNIITPNSDGTNDIFMPILSENIEKMTTRVFNRWGNLIYETDDLQIDWDGKHSGKFVADGVYFWTIDYSGINGKQDAISGTVTILK